MGDLSYSERGQISGVCLAGSSVTKTATLLGVSRVTVSKVMLVAYTNHGKTASAKRNSGQKSTLMERDCRTLRRIVSKNHTATAAQVKELNIHLEEPISTKTS
jgi:transposase